MIVERMVQKIYPGKWTELDEIDKRYDAVEKRLGFPAKKRYSCVMGGDHDSNTLIIEREWDSLGAMEAAFEEAFQDPELLALNEAGTSVVMSSRWEIYSLLQ